MTTSLEFDEVYPMTSITTQIAALSNQVDALPNKNSPSIMESVDAAASQSTIVLNTEQAQCVSNGNYNYQSNNMPNYYHSRLNNHKHISYANNKNVLQPPPGFNAQPQAGKKQSLKDILGGVTKEKKILQRVDNKIRSEPVVQKIEKDETVAKKSVNEKSTMKKDNLPMYQPPLPCPQCFQKKKLYEQFAKLLEIFKKININIPFVDALEKMPNYVKFMKEVLSKKRKFENYETLKHTKECSAILQKNLPQKLRDQGNFTILSKIGGFSFDKALCVLGDSINFMPLSIFKNLGLGEVKPTTNTLQLVDRSFTYPRGFLEDVLVKMDKFVFPVNFLVLDMEEGHEVPLIIGRPFLVTHGALIDVQAANWPIIVYTGKMNESFSPLVSEDKKDEMCVNPVQHGSEKISSKEHIPTVMTHSNVYKEKTKKVCDKKMPPKEYVLGQQVLLVHSCFKSLPRKLKSRWMEPFTITKVFPCGLITLKGEKGSIFQVRKHNLKNYHENNEDHVKVTLLGKQS
ncbi:uncharacterized protein LOC133785284 [Humulus lupulus]|uniref:uncharacterized protein LOC133785284 n=1 Tax=Humulus lupulus TaxID=3486 RepID=UPI002B4052D8|nr:uncharacterized protein LOC133785284 [Humulus lupulus]